MWTDIGGVMVADDKSHLPVGLTSLNTTIAFITRDLAAIVPAEAIYMHIPTKRCNLRNEFSLLTDTLS